MREQHSPQSTNACGHRNDGPPAGDLIGPSIKRAKKRKLMRRIKLDKTTWPGRQKPHG
jgi:hypothetical protein